MKKILFFTFILACSVSIFQQVHSQDRDFVIPRNPEVTVEGKEGARAIATDVFSRNSKLKRNIRLFETGGKEIGEVFIVLESLDEKENMYDQIKNDPNSFSGVLTIEIGGQPSYTRKIINGVALKGELIAAKQSYGCCPPPVYNPDLTCTIGHVHDCVAYNIEGMNWIQYTLCLIAAPHCYIAEWLSCMWQVCIRHMQYTNPN